MPFVEPGIADCNQQRDNGPLQPPTETLRSHPMEYGNTKGGKFGYVCCLSNGEVHQVKHVTAGGREEPAKNGNNDATCLLTTEVAS